MCVRRDFRFSWKVYLDRYRNPMRKITFLNTLIALVLPACAYAGEGLLEYRGDLSVEDRARVSAVTQPATSFEAPEKSERRQAGAGTTFRQVNRNAFSHPLTNLSFAEEQRFKVGNGIFKKIWVSAPASTRASDGLGPIYNSRACQRCHLKDGRGHPPQPGEVAQSMFLRLSVAPQTAAERQALENHLTAVIPEPNYGGQLQNFAIPGVPAEGRMEISYQEIEVQLAGGEVARLRAPTYRVADPGYGALHPDAMMSPRVANQMIGLGLLEAIHPGDILANADPDDADGDGISGRANQVRDAHTGEFVLGRFGWKAGMPTIEQQSAGAFAGDIGISSLKVPRHSGDCTPSQTACLNAPNGVQTDLGSVEAPAEVLDLVVFYARTIGVPARRNVEGADVLAGKALFYNSGCASCHAPKYVTRRDVSPEALAFQLIWPYTDMLLHDMGPGLADGRPEWLAEGTEWRTAPLWGIGHTEDVSGHTLFLHDGRARSLLEAILWHGGEAAMARQTVVDMKVEERRQLLAFLNSL